MRKIKLIILFCLVLIFIAAFTGCSNKSIKGNYEEITPEQAKQRIDSENVIVILDVRTIEEYKEGHIENSLLIPLDNLEKEAEINIKDKDTPIFVYCRSGNRSVSAAKILVSLGYKKVYNLGGIIDWPYEVVK